MLERYRDQSMFLFVHTYLVHSYRPLPEYLPENSWVQPSELAALDVDELLRAARGGDTTATEILKVLYRGTVAEVDGRLVAPIIAKLQQLELDDETLVVLLSDHGEAFLEHDVVGHGQALWGPLVNIPMIWHGPGVEAGLRDQSSFSLADVAPTLLAALRLPPLTRANGSVWGQDRENALSSSAEFLHFEAADGTGAWHGMVAEQWKLLQQFEAAGGGSSSYLFQSSDSMDQSNLAAAHPKVVAAMAARLRECVAEYQDQPALNGELPADLTATLPGAGLCR